MIKDPSHVRHINQVTGTPESNSFREETIIKKLIKEPQLRYRRGTREDAMEGLHARPLMNFHQHIHEYAVMYIHAHKHIDTLTQIQV